MAPLSIVENVALPLLLGGVSESEATKEALAMLDRLGLEALASRLPEELSGGQTQRAGIARALVGTPQLILADEPTGQSDRVTGDRLMDVLVDVARSSGSALVIATHDPAVSKRMDQQWQLSNERLELLAL